MNLELLRKVGEDILENPAGFDIARSQKCIANRTCKLAMGEELDWESHVFHYAQKALDLTNAQRNRLFCEAWTNVPSEVVTTSPACSYAIRPSSSLNAQAAVTYIIAPMIAEEEARRRAETKPVKAEFTAVRELLTA